MMDKVSFFVLFSLAIVAKSIDVQYGFDRPGGDMAGMPIILDAGGTAVDCGLLCENKDDCHSWAFSTCGSQKCFLKYEVVPPTPNNCGVRNCTYFAYNGTSYNGPC